MKVEPFKTRKGAEDEAVLFVQPISDEYPNASKSLPCFYGKRPKLNIHNIIMKIEHIGIAVQSLGISEELFGKLLGEDSYKRESVEREGVTTSFFKVGESKIELLEASQESSPIAKFLGKRGEGVHHIAFAKFLGKRGEGVHHIAFGVEDIYAEINRLKATGFHFISEEPKEGADNKMVVFLHPKSTNGVLIELCQEKS